MHSQLIAMWFVFACQLTAGTIDLTVTSATASWMGPGYGSLEFSITGPSLGVAGHAGYALPLFFATGAPLLDSCLDCSMFDLRETFGAPLVPGCFVEGVASGSCSGSGEVFALIPSELLLPSTANPTFTFPAHLTGSYELCAPGPPMCPFPENPVAAINVDLPGELTFSFEGPFPAQIPPGPLGPPFEFDVLKEVQFVSTPIPESSSLILTFIGAVGLALAAPLRHPKPLQR
jgi:hypothetical protein